MECSNVVISPPKINRMATIPKPIKASVIVNSSFMFLGFRW